MLIMNGKRFQSRNRGSFDFKLDRMDQQDDVLKQFQSRNRGSFDFKLTFCPNNTY